MGPFKRHVTYIMAFFTPFNFVTLCQFSSITSPALFTKRHWETVEWEKGRYFAYMATPSCYVISKEVEIPSLGTTEFLDPLVYINNSHWQSSRIIIFWCKYDIVISYILVGYFLDKLFFLLTLILLEHYKKPRRKDWVTENST